VRLTVARGVWWAIGSVVLLLPLLPLPRWSGAPDPGPVWSPNMQAWALGGVVVLVLAMIAGRLATTWTPTLAVPRLPTWWLVAALAAVATVMSLYVMRVLFASNPILVDEVAQLFHAKVFLSGRLAAPPPTPPDAFLVLNTGITPAGWVSQFPPGQTVLLALGLLAHAAWLVNPLLGGVDTVLVYAVGRRLYDERTGLVAALLWAGSAWVMAMSGTYESHVGAVTFVLLTWAVLWVPQPPRTLQFLLAGLTMAAAAATRPLDAVAGALPVLVWAFGRGRLWQLGWSVLGGAPIMALWGYLNWKIYGSPFSLGYTAIWGPAHELGFHTDPWGRPFTPLTALSNLAVGVRRLHIYLEEWPIPALLPLAIWALLSRHQAASDLLVAVGVAAAPLLYFFYWYSPAYPGPRFYYVAAPMLLIGSARAWCWAWAAAHRAGRRWPGLRWDVSVAVAAVIVLGWGWLGLVPRRFQVYRANAATLALHPERRLRALGVRQALVIVPTSWESRLVVQLWALGVPPGLAQTAASRLDACDLQRVIDAARATRAAPEAIDRRLQALIEATPQAVPGVPGWPDPALRLRAGSTPPPGCQVELNRDLAGFAPYGNLAWRNAVGLHSGVVFARDLFERDSLLFKRYPGWDLWRYGPPAGRRDAAPVLTRLGVIGAGRAP
jgi:hypothetical protein